MNNLLRYAILAITLLIYGLPAYEQGTSVRIDCTSANFPACGAAPWLTDTSFSRTFLAGQGPSGQDAVEFRALAGGLRQGYLGWTLDLPSGTPVPSDALRYIRVRLWLPGPAGQLTGYPVPNAFGKFVILADGSSEGNRMICDLRDNGMVADTRTLFCARNIDGAQHGTLRHQFTLGAWHNVQIEARGGSNASFKIWVDTNDYANPTQTSVHGATTNPDQSASEPFSIGTVGWNHVGVGFYFGVESTISSATTIYRIADDVTFSTTFDPAWHGGGSSTTQCSDGQDNDQDGLVDMADPDCTSPSDTTEAPPPPQSTAPSVTGVSPSSGPTTGGTSIEITGSNFVAGAGHVYVAGVEAQVTALVGSTLLRAVTPACPEGPQVVRVTNPDGQSGDLINGYTCVAPPPTDPCVVQPLVIDQVSWPSSNSGRRSLTFRSNFSWSQFVFVWPDTLTVTDTRNCVRTVTR